MRDLFAASGTAAMMGIMTRGNRPVTHLFTFHLLGSLLCRAIERDRERSGKIAGPGYSAAEGVAARHPTSDRSAKRATKSPTQSTEGGGTLDTITAYRRSIRG